MRPAHVPFDWAAVKHAAFEVPALDEPTEVLVTDRLELLTR